MADLRSTLPVSAQAFQAPGDDEPASASHFGRSMSMGLRRSGSVFGMPPQTPVYTMRADIADNGEGHFAASDSIFKGHLQKLLEEHEKIVSTARQDLLTEITRLKEENSELRSEVAREEQEHVERVNPAAKDVVLSVEESSAASRGATRLLQSRSRTRSDLAAESFGSPPAGSKKSEAVAVQAKEAPVTQTDQKTQVSPQLQKIPERPLPKLPCLATETQSSTSHLSHVHTRRQEWARLVANAHTDKYMLSPLSRTRLLWDLFAFLCLLADLWATPVQLVFMAEDIVPKEFHVLNLVITVFFVVDIALNFNTGFIDRDKLVMRRIPSIRRYATSWLWVDVLATVPFDLIVKAMLVQFDGDVLSMPRLVRLMKVTKMLKTLRFLKLLRMIRLMREMGKTSHIIELLSPLKCGVRIMQLFSVLAFMAHFHGCIWGLLQPAMAQQIEIELAFMNYYRSLRWAYNAFCVGDMGSYSDDGTGIWTLEMIIASERILMILVVGGWGVVTALTVFQEDAKLNLVKSAAVQFFQQHHVSSETQISVMYCLRETKAAQTMQRHFQTLMSEHLPEELRRTVCKELWVFHLTSLDLVWNIRWWHEDFVSELALLVREEVVASKTVLCEEGHASIAAYYILKGRLEVAISSWCEAIPDFTDGMWVEETALVSPIRRRSSTIIVPVLTRLMTVPTQAFHGLIEELGLEVKFQEYRERQLSGGLCGRCGDVGDHFTHACPHAGDPSFARRRRMTVNKRRKRMLCQMADEGSLGLMTFLHAHRLTHLAPLLEEQNIHNKEALEELDFDALDTKLAGNEDMQKELALLNSIIQEQQEERALAINGEQHLVFLSHYKLESGTEAALMHQELERVLLEDNEPLAQSLHVPIFLDSEDLSDLKELQEHVRRSRNLVLLLTKDILLRPWVLVEIVTAIDSNVRLVPVTVTKTGEGFVFPDEAYYARLVAGQVLDSDGQSLLREHGIELTDIERAIRTVFQKIALPYSPHRSETVRMAEVKDIYKQLLFGLSRESLTR